MYPGYLLEISWKLVRLDLPSSGDYWHCLHSMWQGLCNGMVSVLLSVFPAIDCCSSMRRVCCCGPGGQEISIDCCTAGARQQRRRCSTAFSSKCEQCRVDSRRRRLNTDLFYPRCVAQANCLVLWHCWLGVRKSIRPVKIEWWGVGVVICRLFAYGPAKTASSLASFKSRLVLLIRFRLTQVVLEKRPFNGCTSSSSVA